MKKTKHQSFGKGENRNTFYQGINHQEIIRVFTDIIQKVNSTVLI